jgi:hypothetical protein
LRVATASPAGSEADSGATSVTAGKGEALLEVTVAEVVVSN